MWTYEQRSGELFNAAGELVATGYSGLPPIGKNNPTWQDHPDVGPIPVGLYTIGAPTNLKGGPHGPFVLPLTPDAENAMFGRSAFLIHGDRIDKPGWASKGCVIMPPLVRRAIAASGDNRLRVIEGTAPTT